MSYEHSDTLRNQFSAYTVYAWNILQSLKYLDCYSGNPFIFFVFLDTWERMIIVMTEVNSSINIYPILSIIMIQWKIILKESHVVGKSSTVMIVGGRVSLRNM